MVRPSHRGNSDSRLPYGRMLLVFWLPLALTIATACGGSGQASDTGSDKSSSQADLVKPTSTATQTPTSTPLPPTDTPVPPTATATSPVDGPDNRIPWQGQGWYLHGANLPWFNWGCDFGCLADGGASSAAVRNAVGARLATASAAGMRNIRWWMFPGEPWQITTDDIGLPTGIESTVFTDIDAALALADDHNVYLTFVLFSGPEAIPTDWMAGGQQRSALAEVLGAELFRRYADHPRILSWEVFNEPEFRVWDGTVSEFEVVETVRAIAEQANAETESYITVGSATLDGLALWVDVGLDYYQAHWYDYMDSGGWCARCTDYASVKAQFGLDAPLVIGEYFGGSEADALQRLEDWYGKGYAGAWAWSLFPDHTADRMAVDDSASAAFAEQHEDIGPRGE